MKKALLLIILYLSFAGNAFSQSLISLSGYPIVTTGWTIGGAAFAVDSEIELTPSVGSQIGYVYYSTSTNITACGAFTVDFDYKISNPGGCGNGDGIAFYFINPMTSFVSGGGLGLPNPLTGFVFTMDTWDNDGDGLNPEDELYGYTTASTYSEANRTQLLAPILGGQSYMDDGSWHHVRVAYFSGTIRVYLNGSTAPSMTGTFPITTSGYFGFSAGTGCAYNIQMVKSVHIAYGSISPIIVPSSVCVGSSVTLYDSTAGGTWSSSSTSVATIGSGSGVVSPLTTGTTTITYSYASGCTATTVLTIGPVVASITGTPTICAGATSTFSDATGGGVWNSSATAIATVGSGTGIVTGVSPGTAIISYVLPSGCYAAATVTVNPMPSPIGGTTIVCTGYTTTLTETLGGGTWTSSNTTIASIGSSTGVVTGNSPGTATITYSHGTGAVCFVTTTVTVNVTPFPITGITVVCAGSTTALTDVTTGGTWSSAGIWVATVNPATGVVTGVSGGTTTISYILSTGCATTTTITVNPLPGIITGVTIVCVGQTTALFDAGGGTWSSSNTSVATVGSTTGVVSGLSIGSAIITYSLSTGCLTTAVINVFPSPTAITGITSVCIGGTSTLSDATTGGTWTSFDPSVATIILSTGLFTGISAGTTTITYTIGFGCYATTVVTVNPTPAPITGTLKVCVGSTTVLNDAMTGGTWTSSNSSNAIIDSLTGIVTGEAAGTSTITYILATGCNITTVVTVNPLPLAITGPITVCTGTTIALSDATVGGLWSSSNTAVATISGTGIVTGISAGTATITYKIFSTGCTATTLITVSSAPAPISGITSVCIGATTILSDIIGGGTWSSSNTSIASVGFTTGVVTGIAAGTATITYSLGGSCKVTTAVTVYPLPPAIGGIATVCVGGTTILTGGGGTWSSGATGIATVGVTTGIVTGVSAGTAVISYTLMSTGCIATKTVTVNPLPSAISGITTICIGATTTLSDATTGGTWTSSNTSIATIGSSTGIVTGIAGGTAMIIYTLSGTGCATTTTVTITSPPPPITGTTTMCIGATTTLSNPTIGGTWTSSTTTIATVGLSTGIVTGVSAGTATITYTPGTGCAVTKTVTVNPFPSPISGASSLCVGVTITLSDAGGGTWASSTTTIATIGLTTGVVTGIALGTTTITYTLPTGCITTTTVTVSPSPVTISGTTNLCIGTTTTLSDAISGGTWTSSTTTVATVGLISGVVTGVSAGTSIITYSLGSGCTVTTTVIVGPSPLPITGSTIICIGATTTLSDGTAGGAWSSSNTAIATIGISSGNVTGKAIGTATITYTLGCIAITTVTVSPTPLAITGTTSVCQGSSITLSDAVTGGTWTCSNTAIATIGLSSGIVNGVAAGTATITYSLGSGCIVTTTVIVGPSPLPITGTTIICVGAITTLSNATTGGTWSSSNTSTAIIGVSTGVVTGMAVGSTTITYTLGCIAITTVTVSPTPVAITGLASVCQGSAITLSDAVTGGTWSSSTTTVATVSLTSGIVFGVTSGTATITYSLGSGCMVYKTITVNPVAPITGSTNVCTGLTTTLSDALSGGTWSSSNTAVATVGISSGIVTGAGAGTATITYTLSTGCISTKIITVNSIPLAITGISQVCVGQTTALTDATIGGNWSSSNTSVATVSVTSGVVTGLFAGTATITYSLGSGCTVTTSLTVNPSPIIISGPSNLCAGSSMTLSDASIGGTWSSSNTAVATIGMTTGIVSGSIAGTATITYTLPAGCFATKMISINPLPSVITGTTSVCVGQTTTLNDASPGGTWTSNATAIATIGLSTGIVSGVLPGTSAITYTLGGCNAYTVVTVIPLPSPISAPASVCVGQTAILTDVVIGGSWSSDNTGIATINPTTGALNGMASGTVIISYSVASGCSIFTTIIVNPVSPVTGSNTVCVGQATALMDTTLGGAWSSPSSKVSVGAGTGIVTGVAPGIATISYTTPKGCVATHLVTVNAVPAPITGPDNICIGQTKTYTDATPGGAWSSSDITIADFTLPGTALGIGLGTATLSYTISGCAAMKTVTVAPLPGAIAPASVCIGQTTTLIGSGGGTWSSGATMIATVGMTTGVVTGVGGGVATVAYILSTGCFATTTVTVNTLPAAIVGAPNLCQGQMTTFSDATAGGVWTSKSPGIASVVLTTGDVFGNSYGSTIIYYTLSSTGCQASKSVTVNPVPAPISGVSDVCVGATLTTLTDATAGGTWTSSLSFIGTIDSITGQFSGLSGGTTQVDYILGTGCMTSVMITVNLPPLPITGANEVCVGYNTTLNDASPWGAWSSINTSIATIDPVAGVVTGVTPGTTTISYTLMTTGCASGITFSVSPTPSAISGNTFICVGSSYTFTDVIGGGTWYSTNPGIAGVSGTGPYSATVSGIGLGPATIVYTLPAGCLTSIAVEVVPLPTKFSVTGGGTFCSYDTGAHIYLSGSVKSTNYLLYNSGKIATGPIAGTGSALDFGLQKVGGTYTVVATNTLTGCSNNMTGSAVIIVNPLVTPTAGISTLTGDTVCNGVSTTFNGVFTGGGPSPVYKWDVNGTIVGAGTSYTFIPANGDVVTFTLTSDAVCAKPVTASSSIKMNVVLPQTPSATLSTYPGDTICEGLPVTITPVPSYGGSAPSYTWMRNGTLAGTGPTFTYIPVKGDWVYCRMTSNYMCLVTKTVTSNTVAITVDSPLIPYVSITANPGTSVGLLQNVTFTAVVTNGGTSPSYQWYINGIPQAGATNSTFTTNKVSQQLSQRDSVSCTVTSSGLCGMTTHQWAYMSVHNVGVKQINGTGSDISVLPNPNKGEFTVKGTLGTINDAEVSLEITDLLGQVVYKNTVTAKSGTINERIRLNNTIANGMYLLNIRSEAGNQVFHLVIEQ